MGRGEIGVWKIEEGLELGEKIHCRSLEKGF